LLKSNQSQSRLKDLGILLALLLLVVLKFWIYLIPKDGVYHAGDFVEILPLRDYFYQNLRGGTWTFWDTHFATGLPFISNDPWSFYPIDLVVGLFAVSFNISRLEIISVLHYWLAGVFTYTFQRQNSLSRAASFVSAQCFIFGGFLLSHSHHPNIIHAFVWLPGILFFLDRGLRNRKPIYALLAGTFLSFSLLGGHPQFFYYILLFIAVYYFFWIYEGHQGGESLRRITAYFILALGTAAGLAAIQWLPLLASPSAIREHLGYDWKIQDSFPLVHLVGFLIPKVSSWTGPGLSEQFSYLGVLPIILGLWAAIRSSAGRPRLFGLALVFFFLLALGGQTPFYKYFYDLLPGFQLFRIPARFNGLLCFLLAILAGYGLEMLVGDPGGKQVKGLVRGVRTMLLLSFTGALFIYGAWFLLFALSTPNSTLTLNKWDQLTSGYTFYLLILGAAFLLLRSARDKKPVVLGLILLISLDLMLVGKNFGTALGPHVADQDPGRIAELSKQLVAEIKQDRSLYRILSEDKLIPAGLIYDAGLSDVGLDSMPGFGPAMLSKEFMAVTDLFTRNPDWLDLLNVKYILTANFQFPDHFAAIHLDPLVGRKTIMLEKPVDIQRIDVQSHLVNSAGVAQGQPVIRLGFLSETGEGGSVELSAGVDTSEWSIDNSEAQFRHKKAAVHSSWEVPGEKYQGHSFAALRSDLKLSRITRLFIEYIHPQGSIEISQLQLNQQSIDQFRRKRFEKINAYTYRNNYCLPRVFTLSPSAWLPNELILSKEMARLDPRDYLLMDEPPKDRKNSSPTRVFDGEARMTSYQDNRIVIQTQTDEDRILVLSDGYHPWWKASIDGQPARIIKVYGFLRGLPLPPGSHRVEFFISPTPLYWGMAVTVGTLILIAAWALMLRRRSKS